MLYIVCPTCGEFLGMRQIPFEDEILKICNMNGISEEKKNELKSELPTKLGLTRYCCRMRLISYIPKVTLIK